MKRKIFLIFAVLFCLLLLNVTVLAQEVKKEETRMITVSGEAKVWVEPDRARAYLGIETLSADVNLAREENATKVQQALEAIKSLKIEGMLIKAPSYHVFLLKEPEYEATRAGRLPKVIGYKVIQDFTVLLQNKNMEVLSKDAAKVVDTALNNSVNIIQDVEFFKEDDSKEKREALALAVKDAMNNAKSIAEAAGVSIESYSGIDTMMRYWQPYVYNAMARQVSQAAYADRLAEAVGTATTLVAGKIAITCNVNLRCKIK